MTNDPLLHSYRASSTREKIRCLSNHPSTEFKCVLVQDGSTSILNSTYDKVIKLEIKHQKQTDDITSKSTPEKRALCRIPPNFLNNEETKTMVGLFNDYSNDIYNDEPNFQVLKINAMIRNISKWSFL